MVFRGDCPWKSPDRWSSPEHGPVASGLLGRIAMVVVDYSRAFFPRDLGCFFAPILYC
ncbi:MAG: hypothetical protein CM1200mP41_17830 [Gammaproteobacteria bacterium]|nr:MAG: hypothetical protein CM1200mP41_17830 [Gammaproteobacteria bacterium]